MTDTKSQTITQEQAEQALEILVQFGQRGRDPQIPRGKAIGYALYALTAPYDCVDAAMESLEQWNGHLSVAVLAAIERGQGKVRRRGRHLRIELPDWWEKL